MARSYANAKGRRAKARYITIPNACLIHANFAALSPKACKLLFDLAAQYHGYNNGDLQLTWKQLSARGWRSRDTAGKALAELVERGWIVRTRQGGRNRCSLFALTFLRVDGNRKLDAGWNEHGKKYAAPNDWRRRERKIP